MPKFTFIHAADLHLGAPFKGLDATVSGAALSGRGSGNILVEAGFDALARLEAACLETGADFLILSGDVYDDKDGVLRARFALRDMFLRLREAGVRVFVAHGNHDPLRHGPLPVAWPDNVTVFGETVSCECVSRDGVPLALVHGVSHSRTQETENLALRFVRYEPGLPRELDDRFAALPGDLPDDIFQVAALHCAVGGAGEGHAPYAPCSLPDLVGAGFAYWALGHVHQGRVLCEEPLVVYPGSLQGLHINETGPHGCVVVRVGNGTCSVENAPLAPVVWEKLRLSLDAGTDTVDVLEERLLSALEDAAGNATGILFCRVILDGGTDLDVVLRRPGSVETLLERVRGELVSGAEPLPVWVKDIRVATSPVRDFAAMAERDDLVGEVVRMADAMRTDPERAGELMAKALTALHGNSKVKKALAGGADSGEADDESGRLADEAKALLCSLLEGGE